jgi:RNA polymerase sigma factor (sigma-70 family)
VAALPARVPTPADLLDAAETERALVAAIARLPSRARTCFVQIELLGMSIDEVAAGSAVSAKAVELRLSSARKQLRSAIPA